MHRRGDVHVCCHDSLRDLAHFSQPNILLAIPLSVLQTHCTIAFTHTHQKINSHPQDVTPHYVIHPHNNTVSQERVSCAPVLSPACFQMEMSVSQSVIQAGLKDFIHASLHTIPIIHVKLSFLCVQPGARSCIIYQKGGSARL